MNTAYLSESDLLLVTREEAAPAQRLTAVFLLAMLIGVVWGLGTGFSHYAANWAMIIQGIVLASAGVCLFLLSAGWPIAWARSLCGMMILVHVIGASMSGLMSQDPLWSYIIRYALLLPTMAMLLGAVSRGEKVVRGLQAGFTLAIVGFSIYHLMFVNMAALTKAQYRLEGFLNPNSVGFIAAMGGVSLLDIGLRRLARGARWRLSPVTWAIFAAIIPCLVLCVATKSRTATIVMMAGVGIRLYLSMGMTRAFVFIILGMLGAAVAWEAVSRLGSNVASMYQLFDTRRGIMTGTGRFQAWRHLIQELWLPNFAFGVGPGHHKELLKAVSGVAFAHNGILMNLAETGVVGTLPLLVILAMCFRACVRHRHNPAMHFAIALFVAGFLESLAENMMFSMGNPGSLLFMLSVALLCTVPPPDAVEAYGPPEEEPQEEVAWQNHGL